MASSSSSSSSPSSFNLSTRKNDASINASSLSSSSSSRSCFDQTASRIVSFYGQQSLLEASTNRSPTATATATTSSQNHLWSVVEEQPPSPVPESSTIQYDHGHQIDNPIMMMIPNIPTLPPKPPKLKPGPFDVICARGKQAYNHDGNKHFRGIVSNATEKYSKVESKLQRSMIVTDIVDAIRDKGGFLRKNDTTGEWIECSDVLCREKVGQFFRSALGCRFKSRSIKKSNKIDEQGGQQRRKRIKTTACIPLRLVQSLSVIVFSNKLVETIMERLSIDIIFIHESSEDAFYEKAITANMKLLSIIKEDKKLVNQFCVEQQLQEEGEESVAVAKTLSDRDSISSISSSISCSISCSSSSSSSSCNSSTSRETPKNCGNARAA